MDKMREALRRWHYEKSEAHDQLDFPKIALNLSSAEGFEAGYTIATAAALAKNAELEQQIAVLREALEATGLKWSVVTEALAQPFDTSALEKRIAEAIQTGRDQLQKELASMEPVAWQGKAEKGYLLTEQLRIVKENYHYDGYVTNNCIPLIPQPTIPNKGE